MRCLICKLYDNAADVFQYVCKVQMMGLNKQVFVFVQWMFIASLIC